MQLITICTSLKNDEIFFTPLLHPALSPDTFHGMNSCRICSPAAKWIKSSFCRKPIWFKSNSTRGLASGDPQLRFWVKAFCHTTCNRLSFWVFDLSYLQNSTYLMKIEGVERFEEKLRQAEAELGIPEHGRVPITYKRQSNLIRIIITLGILSSTFRTVGRMFR